MSSFLDCKAAQTEEIKTLTSIYGGDILTFDSDKSAFELKFCLDEKSLWALSVRVFLPITYPQTDPPAVEIHTECLSQDELLHIHGELQETWFQLKGQCILLLWLEKIREFLLNKYKMTKVSMEATNEEKKREKLAEHEEIKACRYEVGADSDTAAMQGVTSSTQIQTGASGSEAPRPWISKSPAEVVGSMALGAIGEYEISPIQDYEVLLEHPTMLTTTEPKAFRYSGTSSSVSWKEEIVHGSEDKPDDGDDELKRVLEESRSRRRRMKEEFYSAS